MITGIVLIAGFGALAALGALFGADSRDRRWSIVGTRVGAGVGAGTDTRLNRPSNAPRG